MSNGTNGNLLSWRIVGSSACALLVVVFGWFFAGSVAKLDATVAEQNELNLRVKFLEERYKTIDDRQERTIQMLEKTLRLLKESNESE